MNENGSADLGRVLIIDDTPQNVLLIRGQLERAGYVVESAATGREGLDLALAKPPDLILLDIMMPGLDGYQVCQLLRENVPTRATPVIVLTSLNEQSDKLQAYENGADDFLSKPVDRAELLSRVSSLLRLRRLYEERGRFKDLSDRRQAETVALQADVETERALRVNEARFRKQYKGFPLPTYSWLQVGDDFVLQDYNDAAEAVTECCILDGVGTSASNWYASQPEIMADLHACVAEQRTLRREMRHRDRTTGLERQLAFTFVFVPPQTVMIHTEDLTERKRAETSLQHQAWHDLLTGLPNRTRLRVELDRLLAAAEGDDQPFALLLMDLDRFKEINDTLGHRYGDQVLQQVGARFWTELREVDILARLGGDEFAVLLPGADAERARELAERLQAVLERPFQLEGSGVAVSGSIGIALCPEHGADADTLLQRADVAMYVAKGARSGCALYEPDRDRHSPERLRLIADLKRAIEGDELILNYQPQVDVRSGALTAVEALVRWPHPERGLVPPGEFIPLVEQTRLIRPLTRWVLSTALHQCAAWREAGLDVPVAVNVSANDLQDQTLPELVTELLASSGVNPEFLRLEITESSLMADPPRARDALIRLRAQGVQVAIDDFGTGYSSLAYLKRLPVDELKIDRSFVRDMATDEGARAIVRAVIDLAEDLGLRVAAEGVEDQATWEVLAALGCDVAQGYYFAPPLAPTDLAGWAQSMVAWRFDDAQRTPLEATLRQRAEERGARLTAEEEFVARKQAEAALRTSEERNRLALQAASMGTWDVDVASDVHTWSPETEALFGQAPGTFAGNLANFRGSIHPDDWSALDAEWHSALAERRDFKNAYRTVWPDGSTHWIEDNGRALYSPDGTLVRVTGTSMDITERKQAETDLRASEGRNRLALEAAGMGTWDWDVIHDVHTWSAETEVLSGLAPGTFDGTSTAFRRSIHPDDWPAFEIEESAALAERRDSITRYRVVWPDGSIRWLESKARALYATDGTLLRVTGTCMDITERKLAQDALLANEERFRNQYKSFPLPTYTWLQVDGDFEMQDFNDAAVALGEGDVTAWLGVRASERYADQPEILADLHACATEQHMIRRERAFKYPASGRERQIILTCVFVPPHTVMVHSEDVTEVRQAEQQREALARSEKLRALGQMASGIAHDLNQSLMLVASYSDLARQALVQEPPNVAEAEDLLTTTTQAALDGGETVKRLLQFTRAAPEQDSQLVDLSNLVRDAAQLTAPRWRDAAQAEGRPISLYIETEGQPTIQGSAARLRELMTNLIFNAVDALPAGGTIRLRVVAEEDGLGSIEIADSGMGMSAEVQARVFEPFFTTKGERGTGLGLAMVFGIVEQHGGHIEVRSAPGDGTTFRMTFPLGEASAEVEGSADAETTTRAAAQLEPTRPLQILVVDDEPMMTKAVVRMLKPAGHAVSVANSGEEALETLSKQAFDVVVSDMGMGAGMTGWELADAVKRRWPNVRFLLATGWGAALDPGEARTRGVEAVLSKPYQPADLLQALARPGMAA